MCIRDRYEGLLSAASPLALRFQRHVAIAGIRQLRLATDRLAKLLGAGDGDRDQPGVATGVAEETASDTGELEYTRAALNEWSLDLDRPRD